VSRRAFAYRSTKWTASWRERVSRRFFVGISIAMLAFIVLGFGPTLFFRRAFDGPALSSYLFVHGAVLCTWFVWFLVQSSLIAIHRTDLHGRSGIAGIAIAVCVVATNLSAMLGFLPRMRDIGGDFETEGVRFAAGLIGDSLTLVVFVTLVALAITFRRRPDVHKRLMLFASLQILGPAGARTPYTFAELGLSPIFAPVVLFVLLIVGAPIAYDLIARGRLHRVTIACLPIHVGSVAVSYVIAGNESVRAFVLGFE
jgi:hypothetical protein